MTGGLDRRARCAECGAPMLVRPDFTTFRPHLSWCRWAPRPARVTLLARLAAVDEGAEE